nr:immunoglobulin heavy chain junction region [Mus musculus]
SITVRITTTFMLW